MPDFDCKDGLRTEVGHTTIVLHRHHTAAEVCLCPAPSCEHKVTYERSDQSDVASDYQYLASTEGDRFITADTQYILVLKTAENQEG